jgi:hypothetical protein
MALRQPYPSVEFKGQVPHLHAARSVGETKATIKACLRLTHRDLPSHHQRRQKVLSTVELPAYRSLPAGCNAFP